MSHSIVEEQNKEVNIERNAAQRELYSTGKNYLGIAFIISVPLMIALSILAWYKGSNYSWILVLASFLVLIVNDIFLIPLMKKKRDSAARIQELFDTDVLDMPWNDMAGDKPDPETIKQYADKHLLKPENRRDLLNWYSDVLDSLPLEAGRIISQRSNFSWDSNLRKRYILGLKILAASTLIVVLITCAIMDLTIREQLVTIIASLMPAIVFFTQQIRSHQQAIDSLDQFKTKTEALWKKVIDSDLPTEIESRQLQDALFNLRRTNPLIFDWIYNYAKKGQEDAMYYAVEASIKEYKERKH